MNSQQSAAPPPPQQPQPPRSITNSYPHLNPTPTNHHSYPTPNPNQNPRFPFTSSAPKPYDYSDSPSPSSGLGPSGGFSIEPRAKKRGRPKKYSPDGGSGGGGNNIALGLAPTPVTPISAVAHAADSDGGGLSLAPSNKRKGRPASLGKIQLDALGPPGVGFTPHVILINQGEDVAAKIMAFFREGPRTMCILSATGAISNVTLRQPATSGGTVTYEGRFQIVCITSSFSPSETNGNSSRSGGLSVSLAGPDGRVLGGAVAGILTAGSPVQIIVGSFIADGKKSKYGQFPTTPSHMLNFAALAEGASPSPQGTSSESSEDNGNGHLNHGSGPYGNASQPMPMYTNMGWANTSVKVPPR